MTNPGKFRGWHMVGLALLGQSLGFGLFNGSFGTLVSQLEQQVGMSRVQSTFGFSIEYVMLALTSIWAGNFLSTRNLRWAMVGGVLLLALAFLLLSMATLYPVYLLSFACAGAGIAITTIVCPLLLVCRWFNAKRGLALGIANTPFLLPLAPPLTAMTIPVLGAHSVLWFDATICLVVAILIALFLVERPADIGQTPLGEETAAGDGHMHGGHGGKASGNLSFLWDWRFWIMAFSLGLLNGNAGVFISHIIPFATESGHSLQEASSFIFIFGLAGLIGVPLGGLLADRIGGAMVLALASLASVAFFGTLTLQVPMAAALVVCAVYGGLLNGVIASQGAAYSQLFRPDQVGRIAGTMFLAQLPIMSAAPPLTGQLRDMSGSYAQPFQLLAGLCLVGAFLLVIVSMTRRSNTTAATASA